MPFASVQLQTTLSGCESVEDIDSRNNNDGSANGSRASNMSSVASLISRRNKTPPISDARNNVVTVQDVRNFVFQATSRSDKRIMGGLTAHTFTSQTFISSFVVGLAIGSILAIVIKLFTEIGYRLFPYH